MALTRMHGSIVQGLIVSVKVARHMNAGEPVEKSGALGSLGGFPD